MSTAHQYAAYQTMLREKLNFSLYNFLNFESKRASFIAQESLRASGACVYKNTMPYQRGNTEKLDGKLYHFSVKTAKLIKCCPSKKSSLLSKGLGSFSNSTVAVDIGPESLISNVHARD